MKSHPLSEHARAELEDIAVKPVPTQCVNPGVSDKLTRDGLAVVVQLASPFKIHRGKNISHLQITDKGREVLKCKPT